MDGVSRSGKLTVFGLFAAQVRRAPDALAVTQDGRQWTYRDLDRRVRLTAAALRAHGIRRGDRVVLLSENRHEYIEIELAAALLGAIVACQNWRLARDELRHCIQLVDPGLVVVSERFEDALAQLGLSLPVRRIETLCDDDGETAQPDPDVDPEDGLVILYTSGTTGLPKGALISHRAEIARMAILRLDMHVTREDGFLAWAPMFHMGSTDQMLAALMSGGAVHVVDGFDARTIVALMKDYPIGWMILMPGSIEPVIDILAETGIKPKSIRSVGAMADLVPTSQIARLSALANAPYFNSFGATETGLTPACGHLIPPGEVPDNLDKIQSSMCDVRLLDPDGNEVPDGEPGEVAVRGPSVFSGYWNAPDVNERDFKDGWFRMGDLFVRTPEGRFRFVDRAKYMIKSGGENIYPAEIERVLLADPRVREAVVVRRKDDRWGEVPVAFIAPVDGCEDLDADAVEAVCRISLAGYKRPKEVRFIAFEDFPRSTTGKIQRHEVERKFIG